MKFRRLVLLFIGLLLVVSWLTKPGLEKFQEFYQSELKTETPPLIDFRDKFLFTTADIDFYQAARIDAGKPLKAVVVRKENYLGLFGRFWKL